MSADPTQGLVDTNILILRDRIDVAELPDEMAVSAMTLAELSAGPHLVRPDQAEYDEHAERARRIDVLQRVENEFDPIPFGPEAARLYGPLYTSNPDDYKRLDHIITLVPVARPLH